MGGRVFDDDEYLQRSKTRAASNAPIFAHTVAMQTAPPEKRGAHASMNPMGVKVRESRDSDVHPNSLAIVTALDVTGSMDWVPKAMQKTLCKLMGLFVKDGCAPDAAIMVAGIGDAHGSGDKAPLQVGQFESGIEIENDLTNLYLEGGGGGQGMESYDLLMYFVARHTSIDCWEKRQQKGFLFIIGDEGYYPLVEREFVSKVIGDPLEADIPIEEIYEELSERYEVFFIMPKGTDHYGDPKICDKWRNLLGERFLKLEEAEGVCDLIVSTVSLILSGDLSKATTALKAAGTSLAVVGAIENALAGVAKVSGKTGVEMTLAGSGASSGAETL
jgi:hypothetical protein